MTAGLWGEHYPLSCVRPDNWPFKESACAQVCVPATSGSHRTVSPNCSSYAIRSTRSSFAHFAQFARFARVSYFYLSECSLLGRGSSVAPLSCFYSLFGFFYSRFVIDSLISLLTQCSASLLAWLSSNRPLNWNLILPRSTPWFVHSIGFAQPNEVLI